MDNYKFIGIPKIEFKIAVKAIQKEFSNQLDFREMASYYYGKEFCYICIDYIYYEWLISIDNILGRLNMSLLIVYIEDFENKICIKIGHTNDIYKID